VQALRVGSSIGHREQARPNVLSLEVLIREFFAIDRLAAGALSNNMLEASEMTAALIKRDMAPAREVARKGRETDIATGEVASLQHELGNDAVELAALVAKAPFVSAEGSEVLGCLRDYIVVEDEVDAALLGCTMQQQSARLPAKEGSMVC
jgi:hypothetical protein